MDDERLIAGLGKRNSHVAVSPRLALSHAKLTEDEAAVVAAIGKVRQLGELVSAMSFGENRTIVALLALRARGLIVKARVHTKPKPADVSAAMLEKVAIDDALKAEILELEAKLAGADHFTLIGVAIGAEIPVVKAAFYKLSFRLHPDRYFRRNLGSFRARLEKVFRTLSAAHKTLTHPASREAYLLENPSLRGPSAVPAPAAAKPSAAPAPAPIPKGKERSKRMMWQLSDLQAPGGPGTKVPK